MTPPSSRGGTAPALTPEARRRALAFFAEFEVRTSPVGIRADGDLGAPVAERRVARIEGLFEILQARLAARFHQAAEHDPRRLPPARALPRAPPAWVRALSSLQLGIMRAHYPGVDAGLDLDTLRAALERFAEGSLDRLRPSPCGGHAGRPDGAAVFLWAEFGFLALDEGVDVDAWTRLLPALVAMQDVYLFTAGRRDPAGAPLPDDPPPRFNDYGPARDDVRLDAAAWAEIRARHAGRSPTQLQHLVARRLVREAFPGGLLD